MNLFEDLKWRGLIKDISDEEKVKDLLNNQHITFYWGTDPTANSLHIGHYSSLVTAKRLALAGHKATLLVGGATGLIGDPRPTAEREIISYETVQNNIACISNQVKSIVPSADVVNNYDWISKMNFIDFLRDVGKYINVNYMLNKDIINRRLETGITFAEFSYTLIQGYDFVHLFKEKNCVLQVAGSDQWGNMTTGIELIRKMLNKEANAFTMPLILDENGNKFGKSEGNALWLDESKTSSYELYQYLINSADSKVEEYLRIFTFLSKKEIENIMDSHNKEPHLRIAQKTLAKEFITDLRGCEEYNKALKISECLFNGNIKELNVSEIEDGFKTVPSFQLNLNDKLIDILSNNKIASSRREAREFLTNNSLTINGNVENDENKLFNTESLIGEKYMIIRRGKKKYYIGKIG